MQLRDPRIDLSHAWKVAMYASHAFGVPILVNQVGVGDVNYYKEVNRF